MMHERSALGPRLDFDDWSVAFPERGHLFLPLTDLRSAVSLAPPAKEDGLWLIRAESGVAVIVPGAVKVLRNGAPVVGLAVLHHGERIELAGHAARFHEIQRITVEADSRLLGRRCPQCHITLEKGVEVFRCPLCGEGYCDDCWKDLSGKRCCSRNCRFSPGPVADGQPS